MTSLGVASAFLAAWLVGTNLWANPSYSVGAVYHAALFFGGFLYGRAAGQERLRFSFGIALVFAIAVAFWALWTKVAEADPRAHSLFLTPATLCSVLNLLLAPALVLAAFRARSGVIHGAIVALSAAFVAAHSRGGWLALATALMFALLLSRRAGLKPARTSTVTAVMAIIGGALVAHLLELRGGESAPAMADTASLQERLDLYALALNSLAESSWLFGAGYQAFFYILNAAGAIPLYAGRATYFVHNDYLQTLLELGIPGFIGLLLVVVLPLRAVWRSVPYIANKQEAVAVIALGAAICTMATHALVDFPFYIPVCALMYGAALGFVDRTALGARTLGVSPAPRQSRLRRAVFAGLATIVAWVLTLPVVAEAAGAYAIRQWRDGHNQSAAYWFEAARRLDSRDWRYHWYAGEFWMAQAADTHNSETAVVADRCLAAAAAANPREARILYSRIVLNTRLRKLLPTPADANALRNWANRAVALAPADPALRAERERVLKEFGSVQ